MNFRKFINYRDYRNFLFTEITIINDKKNYKFKPKTKKDSEITSDRVRVKIWKICVG